jgi:hypothetical protein
MARARTLPAYAAADAENAWSGNIDVYCLAYRREADLAALIGKVFSW